MGKLSEYDAQYEHDKLPEELTRKLYVSYGMGRFNAGRISISQHGNASSDGFECIPLAEMEVTFKLSVDCDLKTKAVRVLEKKKDDIKAEYHMKLKEVQDKIDHLLAIEFKPQEATNAR